MLQSTWRILLKLNYGGNKQTTKKTSVMWQRGKPNETVIMFPKSRLILIFINKSFINNKSRAVSLQRTPWPWLLFYSYHMTALLNIWKAREQHRWRIAGGWCRRRRSERFCQCKKSHSAWQRQGEADHTGKMRLRNSGGVKAGLSLSEPTGSESVMEN